MKTEVVTIQSIERDGDKIRSAAHLLDTGGIVAFPTETVYGLGCVAEPEAIARLDRIKGRPPDKRYTLHVGDKEDVRRYVPRPGPKARKLISRAWPGPVTIVFSLNDNDLAEQKRVLSPGAFSVLYSGGTIGIRCIDNYIGRALLRQAAGPIVAPSANRSGQRPATRSDEVLSMFDGQIPMVLAGEGPVAMSGQSSTVVKVSDSKIETLRPGVVSDNDIASMSEIRILFVCTGNTCRSPMVAGLSRKLLSEKLNCGVDGLESMGYIVMSCGLAASESAGASPNAVAVCKEAGVDISGHLSKPLHCEEVRRSDYIFGMTQQHVDAVRRCCPEAASKCGALDDTNDIADPISGDKDAYRKCAEQIEKALKKRLGEIWDENRRSK